MNILDNDITTLAIYNVQINSKEHVCRMSVDTVEQRIKPD
jgi:hypothetical protein